MDLQLRLLPYQYRQLEGLEWIQVVKLWPSTTLAKPPRVDIQHVDRSSIPFSPLPERLNYDAVSYAWSEYTRNSKIVCNGDSILAITPTVYVMLQWLRHESKPRYLWIDSICLNQDDRQEKEVQIPQMGQIYREARKARVWLGEGAEDTQKVLTLLTVLGRANDPPDDATIADTFHKLHLGPVMKALKEFLHRKWFHRYGQLGSFINSIRLLTSTQSMDNPRSCARRKCRLSVWCREDIMAISPASLTELPNTISAGQA